jgi:hypothetical protein
VSLSTRAIIEIVVLKIGFFGIKCTRREAYAEHDAVSLEICAKEDDLFESLRNKIELTPSNNGKLY